MLLHEDTRTGGIGGRTGRHHHGERLRIPGRPDRARDRAGHAGALTARRSRKRSCPMRKRSSRRLAGCIVIELALAAAGLAADYRAGAAASGSARALVLEDARGNRAVFTQTEFRITQALADFVAARLLVALELERAGLLFHWSGIGARPEQPEDLVTAITTAVNALEAGGGPLRPSLPLRGCRRAMSGER